MINRVILVGNLTRDAEPISTSGVAMTRLRLATNSRWKDAEGQPRESAEFHALVCFGRTAEVLALYGTKGRRIYLEGHLRTREYDGKDGLRRTSTEIVLDSFQFLGPREDAPRPVVLDDPAQDVESPAVAVAS